MSPAYVTLLASGTGAPFRFHWIDLSILAAYLVGLFVIGWIVAKKASKNLDSYFLGGKSLPWWIVGTSHGATGFDVTGTMWFTAMIFIFGLKGAWLGLVWPIFDRVFRQVYLGAWIRRSNVLTGAEWMNTRFGKGVGGNLSYLSVVIYAVLVTLGWLGYAYAGIGRFAGAFLPWDLSFSGYASADVYAMMILGVTTAYVIFGGWYSVILTDVFQAVLKTIAALFIGVVAMRQVAPEALAAVVPPGWFDPIFGWSNTLNWSGLIAGVNEKIAADGLEIFGGVMLLWFFRGTLVSLAGPAPGYGIQHILSTRSPREAALENWFMSIVQLFPRNFMMAGVAVLGLVYFGPVVNKLAASGKGVDFEQVLPLVIRDFLPVGLVGLLIAGLLAAFMGMFNSTLNAGAAYIVNDLYKRYFKKDAPVRHYVKAGYLTSVILVVVTFVIGSQLESITEITRVITGMFYAAYLAPNILKWHWWRFNAYGYVAGMATGVAAALVLFILQKFAGFKDPTAIKTFLVVSPLSLVASVVVSLLTRPESDEVLDKFYLHVRPWGFWGPVYQRLVARYPRLQKNRDFGIDMLNVIIAIVWMFGQVLLAIAMVTKQWNWVWISAGTVAATSFLMHFTWWKRLGKHDGYVEDLKDLGIEVEPPRAAAGGHH
jgi:Na+/proline symporter